MQNDLFITKNNFANFHNSQIADLDHDLYCFECHSPGNLQKCSLCPRVFHEHCTPANANSSSTNKRGQSPPNQQPVTTNDTTTESVEESVSQMETTVNEADIEEQQPPAEHVEEKPSFKREVASSTEDIRIQRLLSQNSETKDVMCMGEVRPPSRRTRRVLSTYEKLDASALDTDENQDNVMLCTSCRLYRTQSDPVIEAEEKNYLLKFIFTRIKTWVGFIFLSVCWETPDMFEYSRSQPIRIRLFRFHQAFQCHRSKNLSCSKRNV